MKKVFLCIYVVLMSQTAASQHIEYEGYDYDISEFSPNDSMVTFYPIDETKLTTFKYVDKNYVECEVPNYPEKTVSVYVGRGGSIYQRISTTIVVEDTVLNQEAYNRKREYLEFRLAAIDYIRGILADIMALDGKKLTDEKQIVLYKEVMGKYGEPKSAKEMAKLKVGKYFKAAVPHFEGRMSEEEQELRNFCKITDWESLLSTRIPSAETMSLAIQLGINIPSSMSIRLSGWTVDADYIPEPLKRKKLEISFKNPVLSDSSVTARNPMFEGVGYAEWKWLEDLSDDQLEHVQTSFPVESDYYKSDKHPDYQLYCHDYGSWYAVDSANNLVGVQYRGIDEESIFNALLLYDYEHNAYNIQSESKGIQEWALYLIRKRGSNEMDNREKAEMGIFMGAALLINEARSLDKLYARRRITKAEYNRRKAALKKASLELEQAAKKAKMVAGKQPSAEEKERAEKYIEQLKMDNADIFDSFHTERLNGTQFMVYSNSDCRVQALLTYTMTKEGKLESTYTIIDKKK